MQELILYIKEGRQPEDQFVKVDLYEDETISLTAKIQDVRDIEKIFTDFTKTFTLLASKKNNKLFKHWYNPDVRGFDSNFKPDAIIELNYQKFRRGSIQLNDCKLKNGKPEFWSVTFTGSTSNLKTILRDDQLESLSWLDNFLVNNNTAANLNTFKRGQDFTIDGVLYEKAVIIPLIAHNNDFFIKVHKTLIVRII